MVSFCGVSVCYQRYWLDGLYYLEGVAMTITLTREEAQQVLDALEAEHSAIYGTSQTVKATELLRTRLAQPEPKDDGRCQSCEGDRCTAKTGCVALSNPPQRNWQGLTHEEKMEILTRSITAPSRIEVAEALLKEKNSG